jgi:hypothetical protein
MTADNVNVILFQVTGRITGKKLFCAGLETHNDKVTLTAPIIKYMNGWSIQRALKYCFEKRWRVELVSGTISR